MKISRFSPLALLTLFAFVPACATTERIEVKKNPAQEESSTLPASYDASSFCGALCDRQQECDSALDRQTCANECQNRNAAAFPKLRGDVVELVVGCFAAKDCKTVLTGDVVSTCAAEAVASVAPSAAASTYCDTLTNAKKKCGTTTSKADCLNTAKLYDDDAIAQAENCTGRPCVEIDACVAAAFGGFGTASPPPGSGPGETSSCSGRFADLGACSSCAESSCCAEATACAADSTCRAMMRVCSADYGSSSTCYAYLDTAPSSTQQLLAAYYQCASAGCGSSCGPVVTP